MKGKKSSTKAPEPNQIEILADDDSSSEDSDTSSSIVSVWVSSNESSSSKKKKESMSTLKVASIAMDQENSSRKTSSEVSVLHEAADESTSEPESSKNKDVTKATSQLWKKVYRGKKKSVKKKGTKGVDSVSITPVQSSTPSNESSSSKKKKESKSMRRSHVEQMQKVASIAMSPEKNRRTTLFSFSRDTEDVENIKYTSTWSEDDMVESSEKLDEEKKKRRERILSRLKRSKKKLKKRKPKEIKSKKKKKRKNFIKSKDAYMIGSNAKVYNHNALIKIGIFWPDLQIDHDNFYRFDHLWYYFQRKGEDTFQITVKYGLNFGVHNPPIIHQILKLSDLQKKVKRNYDAQTMMEFHSSETMVSLINVNKFIVFLKAMF